MKTAGLLFGTLSDLLHLLRHRYRTGEGADWISDTLEEIEDATSPADLREALSEVLVGYRPGMMKPPRIDELVIGSLRTLHGAAAEDAVDVGGLCVAVRDACGRMLDPYDAQAKILARLPTSAAGGSRRSGSQAPGSGPRRARLAGARRLDGSSGLAAEPG